MIGIILTGHGRFSEGLMSGISMIAGPQDAFTNVNFLEADSTETLETALRAHIQTMSGACDGVLIACDLLGGTPFKVAATLSVELKNLAVVGGINLPSILDALFTRLDMTSAEALADKLAEGEASHIIKFVMPVAKTHTEPEDGI